MLAESELAVEYFRDAIECSVAGVALESTEGIYLYVNPSLASRLGYEPREMVGRPFSEFTHPDDRESDLQTMYKLLVGSIDNAVVQKRYVKRDGSPLIIQTAVSLVHGIGDRAPFFVVQTLDLSVHRDSQAKLIEARLAAEAAKSKLESVNRELERSVRLAQRMASEAEGLACRQGALLNAIPSILIGLHADGTVYQWNEAARLAFAIESAEAVGKPLFSLPIEWDVQELAKQIDRCIARGEPVRVDGFAFQRPDAQPGCLGLTLNPLVSLDGKPGVLILGADVTERRILESQLAQAQKLESIGQLAAGIAHEINTPTQYVGDNLRFLSKSFEMLRPALERLRSLTASETTVGPELATELKSDLEGRNLGMLLSEVPNALQESTDGIERVAHIVRAMKEFSHPGSEQKTLVDINRAISSTCTVARNEWKYVADLELDLDEQLPPVPCIPADFSQTILNIVVNAAHAISDVVRNTPEKGLIKISSRVHKKSAEIRISDTGGGIPESIRDRIFDPFFTTKEVGKGTGQGLNLVHTVVTKRHQGTVVVESEVGVGTTFIIRLPLADLEEGNGVAA